MTVLELKSLPYDEIQGWFEYFEKRPYGWRDDRRAAVVASLCAFGDHKLKPEDMFESLSLISKQNKEVDKENFAIKFLTQINSRLENKVDFKNDTFVSEV